MKDGDKTNSDLVPVHGGLEQPVDRRVPLSGRKAFLSEAEKLPGFEVSNADLSTVYRIADGTLVTSYLLASLSLTVPPNFLNASRKKDSM